MNFFQKYRPPLTQQEREELRRLSSLDLRRYNEADVREEFIVPLLKLLGYQKQSNYSIDREESYKLNPLYMSVGRRHIKLDYISSVRKQYFWIIEAKAARSSDGNPVPINSKEISQAYFYALHPQVDCPYFVVCNGWFTNLYVRDEIGDVISPRVSIAAHNLYSEFWKLDREIGFTQILPSLKNRLLDKIGNVLAAEVYLDRLDEFLHAVEWKLSQVYPTVLKNFKENAKEQEQQTQTEYRKLLENASPLEFSQTIFLGNSSGMVIEPPIQTIISRLRSDLVDSKQYQLFSSLMLIQPRPTNIDYYLNVLRLLIRMLDSGISVLPGYKNSQVLALCLDWIELLLFHFQRRKELRFLWLLASYTSKLAKRIALLDRTSRNTLSSISESRKAVFSEEILSHNPPSSAGALLQTIEGTSFRMQAQFLASFYDRRKHKFKETQALQELQEIQREYAQLEQSTENTYSKLRKELGADWSELQFIDQTNVSFDRLLSGVCELLIGKQEIQSHMSHLVKQRIAFIAGTSFVHYARELCQELDLEAPKPIDISAIEYFAADAETEKQIVSDY